jgi:carboxyl-terminal processing protease
LENYKVERVQYGKNPRQTDFPITERVIDAFKEFVRNRSDFQVTSAQIDDELDFAKLRLRHEIVTAAYSNDAGARVLLESDVQIQRALDSLPDAKRLAESTRIGPWRG